ncbi:unnamed protein product [Mytilus coruscus]|uniref:Uncharacterized protein n=1 Tax=Mytilus coruscus TaxID=42192 RepID=A0A6J8BBB6_MYTCO|nr:unnamed protein product [Mytilus coruscus]
MSDSNVILSVLNPTSERKILKKNIQVASVFQIDEVMSCDLPDNSETYVHNENTIPDHLQPLVENVSPKLTKTEREQLADTVNKYADCPQCIENTEITVGSITQREISSDDNNELNTKLMRPIESNWLEQWTPPILQKLQMEDETIRTVISFLQQNSTKPCIRSQNQELVTLLRQWDQLSLENGLL